MDRKRVYLGDSVYAEFDGFGVVLTTNNGYPDDPRNKIVLEPDIFAALVKYGEAIYAKRHPDPESHA